MKISSFLPFVLAHRLLFQRSYHRHSFRHTNRSAASPCPLGESVMSAKRTADCPFVTSLLTEGKPTLGFACHLLYERRFWEKPKETRPQAKPAPSETALKAYRQPSIKHIPPAINLHHLLLQTLPNRLLHTGSQHLRRRVKEIVLKRNLPNKHLCMKEIRLL